MHRSHHSNSKELFKQKVIIHRSHLYSNSINTGTIQARSQLFINFVSAKWKGLHRKSLIQQKSINTGTIFISFVSAKLQDCIGVTYTATLESLSGKVQDFIKVTYTATQSTLEPFKLKVNYSSTLFHKMENCIGVTYTATQSTLELFKLEVNYSSTLFQQK